MRRRHRGNGGGIGWLVVLAAAGMWYSNSGTSPKAAPPRAPQPAEAQCPLTLPSGPDYGAAAKECKRDLHQRRCDQGVQSSCDSARFYAKSAETARQNIVQTAAIKATASCDIIPIQFKGQPAPRWKLIYKTNYAGHAAETSHNHYATRQEASAFAKANWGLGC